MRWAEDFLAYGVVLGLCMTADMSPAVAYNFTSAVDAFSQYLTLCFAGLNMSRHPEQVLV